MHEQLYALIETLVMLHSPSGAEQEIDQFLLTSPPVRAWQDEAGNIIFHFPGREQKGVRVVTAHKDEIGMMVQRIEADGKLRIARLGGSFPWVYGEGAVDILGREVIQGILSFGARHISHQSPQKAQQLEAALKWEHTWIDTFLTPEALNQAGVQPGTRVVMGRHRKRPLRMGNRVASYALDNKAAIAILLLLAQELQPATETYFIFSAQEEIGALGALHFTHRTQVTELLALEVAPIAPEYPLMFNDQPVILAADAYSYYNLAFNERLAQFARALDIQLQPVVLSGFGSDASLVVKQGHVAQVACLGFPTLNTHGFEVCSLDALVKLYQVVKAYLEA
jgi:putative aminopeptidase FrvX